MNKTLVALLALSGIASAAPIITPTLVTTYVDVVDPEPDVRISAWAPGGPHYFYTHNLVDNGFTPGQQKIYSADLAVTLQDDGNDDMITDGLEFIRIRLDGNTLVNNMEINSGIYHFNVESQYLQQDGKLVVKLTALDGDFYFRQSELTVTAATIPEPGSLALTGLGLLGLGFFIRRRKK